jgi:hypothetical protein
MRAPWLADVLRDAGLTVVETGGWVGRGRDLDSIEGVMWHHTASPTTSGLVSNLAVVTNGNSVAPGPIANLLLWRDGTFHVIADGRCNHAGKGFLPWIGTDRGNACLLAIEAVNNGVGEPWVAQMVEAYERGTAAIIRRLGLSVERVVTHWEYATPLGRKIDPAGPNGGRIGFVPGTQTWSPDSVRGAVRAWLTPPAPPPIETVPVEPPAEEVDDVSIIITNAEQHPVYGAPGTGRFLLLENGTLRHIQFLEELHARGDVVRARWSNAELARHGIM